MDKIKVIPVPKKIILPSIKDRFSSESYYKSVRAIVNKINSHYKWENDTMVLQRYESEFDNIVKFIIDEYTIRNHNVLTAKLAALAYPMKLVGYKGPFINRRGHIHQIPLKIKPLIKNHIAWDDMKHIIEEQLDECEHPGGKVICLCYIHGYTVRCNEIALTSIKNQDEYNFLDLENKRWYIKSQCTKNRKDRDFLVSDEFITEIKPYIKTSGYLISKKNGEPYKKAITLSLFKLNMFTVNDIRNSYETWNYSRDASEEDKVKISINVLGHQPDVARAYYTPNTLLNIENDDKM